MKNFIVIAKPLLLVSMSLINLFYQPLAYADINGKHNHATMNPAMPNTSNSATQKKSQPTIKLSVQKISDEGNEKVILIKLTDIKNNKPVTLKDLSEVHTQKIHMLVIDDSLTDYSHVHPVETNEPGVYQFSWQPSKKDANYRIWADLVPLHTKQQEYVIADLYKSKDTFVQIIPQVAMESIVDGYTFKLSFDQAQLRRGKAAMGNIVVSDAKGKPVHALEPVMGAYAHIVAFSDDFKTVLHIHPMGEEPKKASDRGGPELRFHIEPEKAGFIKVFAQVKINGKDLFAPFGIIVHNHTRLNYFSSK